MNYLGHLYFSDNNPALMLANLFGDFIKGVDYSYLPKIVQEGVFLHREIDDFIDHHPEVTALRLKLYEDLPKVAGIAIDLYFDHLLAKNWSFYHEEQLDDFIDAFLNYALTPKHQFFESKKYTYPPSYIHLLSLIKENNWMKRYIDMEGIDSVSKGLSKRLSFENNLDQAAKVFQMHKIEIKAVFDLYMKDAVKRFKN